ncbi:hypothetical protein NUW58_g2414 [Xylaria curta]|uniref:Uncharacterized protein n=1 Tax=Xylaria curta TaxID=42375 RepID=A0ACC1PIW4_9PEZI|nr:hypothetical protein NUW58_g2414 [Xylaria curta]
MLLQTIVPLLALLHLAASEKASITQLPVYTSQRPCARRCFDFGGAYEGPAKLASIIGCDFYPPMNECFCRPDLQANADAYLLNCVDRACVQNAQDTNSAISIYDEYCTSAGFLRGGVLATTTSGTGDFPSAVTVTVTATATTTVRVSSAQKPFPFPLGTLAAFLAISRMNKGWG